MDYFCSTRSTDTAPLTPSGRGLDIWRLKFGEEKLVVTVRPDNWTTSSFRRGSGSLDCQRPSILGRRDMALAVTGAAAVAGLTSLTVNRKPASRPLGPVRCESTGSP